MQTTDKEETKPKSRIKSTIITLAVIALMVAIAISALPRGFPTDFSVVGKGTNAVVLIYDPNILASTQTTAMLNEIRDDYKGQLEFVIVKIGSPTGRELSEKYRIKSTALLLFAADGSILKRLHPPESTASLRHGLSVVFKLESDN